MTRCLGGCLLVFIDELLVGDVQLWVNGLWNWLDAGAELLLNAAKGVTVLVGDKVDSNSEVTETSRTSDSVKVSLGVSWEVEVDDDIDSLDVDTTGEQVGADQVSAVSLTEVVEDAVSVVLSHLGVNVVARVSDLSDLLGKKFDTLSGVTEDDRLVDLELAE